MQTNRNKKTADSHEPTVPIIIYEWRPL